MGSIGNQQPVLRLTALERIGPKGYLRYVFPFQLQDDYDLHEVAGALKTGYEALTQRIPNGRNVAAVFPRSAAKPIAIWT